MLIQHNHLRECRKRSCLTQEDIAFILGLSHPANVSRIEQGQRKPNLEVLISYHLLFNCPIEAFFERHKTELLQVIANRIKDLVQKLQVETQEGFNKRISYLNEALIRLTEHKKAI